MACNPIPLLGHHKKRRKGSGGVFCAPLSLLTSYSNRDCLLSSKKSAKNQPPRHFVSFSCHQFRFMDTDMLEQCSVQAILCDNWMWISGRIRIPVWGLTCFFPLPFPARDNSSVVSLSVSNYRFHPTSCHNLRFLSLPPSKSSYLLLRLLPKPETDRAKRVCSQLLQIGAGVWQNYWHCRG